MSDRLQPTLLPVTERRFSGIIDVAIEQGVFWDHRRIRE